MRTRFVIAPKASIRGIAPELSIAFGIVQAEAFYVADGAPEDERVFQVYISTGTNGIHSRKSLHYVGLALDIDVPGFEGTAYWKQLVDGLREALGTEFDVVDHGSHIHIEFQPKRGLVWTN